jgi:hypothetical protein
MREMQGSSRPLDEVGNPMLRDGSIMWCGEFESCAHAQANGERINCGVLMGKQHGPVRHDLTVRQRDRVTLRGKQG